MSVDDSSLPPESFKFSGDGFNIISVHCLLGLTESVYIDNSDQVIEFIVSAKIYSFPNTSLGDLAISTNTEDCIVNFIEILT